MILNTTSGNSGARLTAGWKLVKVVGVEEIHNPNDAIKVKVIVKISNDEITEKLSLGSFGMDIPIWNRQNADGSYGGEYDLLNFYRATGAEETPLEGNKTKIELQDMVGKSLNVRFYVRPGSSYADAHAGSACPADADEGMLSYKEQKFAKDYEYMLKRWREKNPESENAQESAPQQPTPPAADVSDQLPF